MCGRQTLIGPESCFKMPFLSPLDLSCRFVKCYEVTGCPKFKEIGMVKTTPKRSIIWSRRLALSFVMAGAALGLTTLQVSFAHAQATETSPEKTAAAQNADASRTQALSVRVEELEEQIVDLQVVIGTLESLAKTGGQPSGATFTNGRAASGDGASNARLEAQVEALSVQVSKLSAEVSALQQGRVGRPIASRPTTLAPPAADGSANSAPQGAAIGTGFGATTIDPVQVPDQQPDQQPDAIGSLIREPLGPAKAQANPPPQSVPATQQPNPVASSEAKATYEQAYGNLLQQDYAAAQAGFRGFLRRFPQHDLVPNALYWLGETYYVQQNYTDAAEAFDIVTAAYARSNKAPDSQLKRGMSLANLGKRTEACTVLRSLAKRYPNAPAHVKSKADSERQRVGCT